MFINMAATAVSLAVVSGITGTQVSNHAVQLSEQSKQVVAATAPKEVAPAAKPTQPAETAQPAQPAPVIVTVQSGDTLSSIAEANNTTYVRIFNANEGLSNPNVIVPGQQLRMPTADEQLPDRMAQIVTVAPAPVATTASANVTPRASVSYPAVSGNDAKAFIYARESGNNPNATNPSGCYGLGQDCNGRVRALCGADYACQDAFFTNYAMSRYGSWEGALAFWQSHHWW